ncbi:MAG: PAS domain-containing protein [Desulfobulbaceae bacterium]|uniref:PAS domain-containing protein n=1 Tax=Candidatus Desulfatifera sulfidica TaxID=2841691 RepID=A0A8J6N5B0_9BACT|nr:PAS domain-containing protein [Candidatus Desulfatifera sulfidica]
MTPNTQSSNEPHSDKEILLDGFLSVVRATNFQDTATAVFNSCQNMTGASTGLIALTSPDKTKDKVILFHPNAQSHTQVPGVSDYIHSLLAECDRQQSAISHNDFMSTPWAQLMPSGHITLKNIIIIPLLLKKQAIGLVALANKKTDFTPNDQQLANTFLKITTHCLKKIHSHEQQLISSRSLAEQLADNQQELQIILDSVPAAIFYKNSNNRFLQVNKAFCRLTGIEKEQALNTPLTELSFTPDLAHTYWQEDLEVINSGRPKKNIIQPLFSDSNRWVRTDKLPYRDKQGTIRGVIGFAIEITEEIKTKEKLTQNLSHLQQRVEERTRHLNDANHHLKKEIETNRYITIKLEKQASKLQKMNSALQVLIDQNQQQKVIAEKNIKEKYEHLVVPQLELLAQRLRRNEDLELLNLIQDNIKQSLLGFKHQNSTLIRTLTAKELEIATLVRHGKTTKDISRVLHISMETVKFHRRNIRRKLGLTSSGSNLRSELLARDQE